MIGPIINNVKDKSPESAMDVIKQVYKYAPSIDEALVIIEKLSRGEEADLINEEVLETLRILVKQDMVRLVIKNMYEIGRAHV